MIKQIKGEAKVDISVYRNFAEFQLFRSANPKLKKRLFYGCGILSVVLFFFMGLIKQSIAYFTLGAAMIIFMLMFTFMTRQLFKKQCRINKRLLNSTQNFVFAPDGFIIEIVDEGIDSREEIFYSEVMVAYDVKDAFYLYKDKKHAFIVPKSGLKKVNAEQARAFLQTKIPGGKYIVVK